MMPLRFGSSTRRLFGVFHAPVAPSTEAPAVLLCPPFGQESIRSHRVFRLLAERLAEAGAAALRFDWYGTGDSGGDDADVDLDGWQRDLLAAHRQLGALLMDGRPTVWLGLRLGATVVALASRERVDRLAKIILWSPVIEGRAWLGAQASAHAHLMRHVRGAAMRAANQCVKIPSEALGFEIPERFAAQVSGVAASALAASVAPRFAVFADASDPHVAALLAAGQSSERRVDFVNEQEPIDWATGEALGSAVAPSRSLARLTELALS